MSSKKYNKEDVITAGVADLVDKCEKPNKNKTSVNVAVEIETRDNKSDGTTSGNRMNNNIKKHVQEKLVNKHKEVSSKKNNKEVDSTAGVAVLIDKCKKTRTEKTSDKVTVEIADTNAAPPPTTITPTSTKTLTGINALIGRSANYAALKKLIAESQYGIRRVNLNRNIEVLAEPRDDPNCNMTIDTS